MKNYLIALYGKSNSGKTTALKAFISHLKDISELQFLGYDDDFSNENADVVALFTYKKIKIGISTGGDTASVINKRVEQCLIKKHKCNIVFTASRTKGNTRYKLEEIEKNYAFQLEWIEKLHRAYDPIKKKIGSEENPYLNKITQLEVEYLADYLMNHILKQ
ncbi:ATP-binding protein [Bisgaard Taxon 10/6]|uniref:ATP-binding protein n=1 Tax=Exercitatus varius TaxID=67857 RepID=UPI00294AD683|nr:ATP-binding protein [Exercitatus varius]MDG2914866.1 ATP-binding protein [Exercitatus varius]